MQAGQSMQNPEAIGQVSKNTFPIYSIKPHASPTKSLLEIQDEQARQLERERQKREENHQQVAKVSLRPGPEVINVFHAQLRVEHYEIFPSHNC